MAAVAAVPDPPEDEKIVIDLNELTVGELEQIEDVSGRNALTELGHGNPSAKTLMALIYVVQRRDNPTVTMDDARRAKLSRYRIEAPSSPKEPAG